MQFSLKDRPITQGVISSAIYAALIFGGGAVLAYLKLAHPAWFTAGLWGLVGSALITFIVVAFVIWRRLPKLPPEITPENVEAKIREWLDSFRFSIKREVNPEAIFALVTAPENGLPVVIARPKTFDRYIVIEASVTISPEDRILFDRLSEEEQGIFAARLSVELSRNTMGFVMDLRTSSVISLQRRLPITSDLTESTFMAAVDEVGNARLRTLRVVILMLIDVRKKLAAAPEATPAA